MAESVDSGNRCVWQGVGHCGPSRCTGLPSCWQLCLLYQACSFCAGRGKHHRIKRLPVDQPLRSVSVIGQCLCSDPQVQLRSTRLQPTGSCGGKEAAEISARNQQVGAALAAEQSILQHAQEDAAAGLCGRQVKGRDAQGVDKIVHQSRWQAMADVGHRGLGLTAKAAALPAVGGAQQGQFFAPAPAFGAGNANGSIPWRAAMRQLQPQAIHVAQIQWQP